MKPSLTNWMITLTQEISKYFCSLDTYPYFDSRNRIATGEGQTLVRLKTIYNFCVGWLVPDKLSVGPSSFIMIQEDSPDKDLFSSFLVGRGVGV